MSDIDTARELERHTIQLQQLAGNMETLMGDVRSIRDRLSEERGQRKILHAISAFVGAAAAIIAGRMK